MRDNLPELQRRFVNLRLGTFIHFNSAAFQFHTGEGIDWEYDCENSGAPRRYPFAEKDWNPTELDCRQWAAVARAAGFRFAAYTAKHHEGFAAWPTAFSEHCVRNAANKTDVVAAYLEAFREAGIAAGLYFSILDLTAGIGKRSCTQAQKEMIRGQITELLTNYGEIPFLIVDGWNAPWGGPTYEQLPFEEVNALVKSLQPECLLLNIGCTDSTEHTDIVFFENGAGQEVGQGFQGPGVLCQKLTRAWFWRADDPHTPPASGERMLELMEKCFPMNVALMMNLSPNTKGLIDENLAQEYRKTGEKVSFPPPLETIPSAWQTSGR